MFEKIKKIMPESITLVGIIISVILIILSRFSTGQGYYAFIIGEYMRECAMVVLAECLGAAAAFRILIKKQKFANRDFPQN